ncbi:MAG: flavin reductase family protein [Clostridia bacterium]|nr:flavin reductase family protein [Clostridia bacterium]
MSFEKISYEQVTKINSDKLMRDWMLITAGNTGGVNTMLASWGGIGVLWGGPVAFIFVRESRYTKKFIDENECFSLTFFTEDYKQGLSLCGTVSGRDNDKIKNAGLTVVNADSVPYFSQASIVFNCRKLSATLIDTSDLLDKSIIERFYGDNDRHIMYVGKIEEILVNNDNL